MKLRVRLALATTAIAVPVFAALFYVSTLMLEREGEAMLAEMITARMHMLRESCEASPADWHETIFQRPPRRVFVGPGMPGGPGLKSIKARPHHLPPPPEPFERPPHEERTFRSLFSPPRRGPPPEIELYAYDSTFTASSTRAPELSPKLRTAIGAASTLASYRTDTHSELLVRMPWSDGPCAFVLARKSGAELEPRPLPPLFPLFVVVAVVIAAFLVALGPVVRRIGLLEREVRQIAASGYHGQVALEGSDEIAGLARAFEDAGREVRAQMALQEQREKTLREFLENTTHDVNTPLTVLLGHLKALQDKLLKDGATDRDEASITASALREAHYMASLMHNLAVAAKLEAGEPEVRRDPVDLSAVVERAVARHQPIAGRTGVALDRAVPAEAVYTRGDVTFIEQAVSNLIDNAVRHNQAGGHVAVVLEREGARFSLRVLDDGPGIPEAELSRVVDRHFRGNSARTRGPTGHGLGLNIAARVADHHGFELELKRSELGGVEIELRGPTSAA